MSDKPVLKKVVFRITELVSQHLYRVYFKDDHRSRYENVYEILAVTEMLHVLKISPGNIL